MISPRSMRITIATASSGSSRNSAFRGPAISSLRTFLYRSIIAGTSTRTGRHRDQCTLPGQHDSGGRTAERSFCSRRQCKTPTDPLGLACDWRVVLHELGGHGTIVEPHQLWLIQIRPQHRRQSRCNPQRSGQLRQGQCSLRDLPVASAPQAPARSQGRAGLGVGWNEGPRRRPEHRALDPKGYQSEQILSTTHFRIYRAIGGDAAEPNMRRFAARFAAYLILRTVGSLTPVHAPDARRRTMPRR